MADKKSNTLTYIHYYCSWFKSKRHAERLACIFSAMSAKGWNCILVLSGKPADSSWEDIIKSLGVTVLYHPRPEKHFDFKCAVRVYNLCKQYKCEILHCDNMHTSPLIGAFMAGVKVRIWYKRAMNSDFEMMKKKSLKDRIAITTRLSCMLSTNIITVSSAVKKELVDICINEEKISVNNNPRPLSIQLSDREATRKEFGYSENSVVALSIGHAVPVKGWTVLIEAFNMISGKLPDLSLLLVGSTISKDEKIYFDKISDYISRNNLNDRVRFTGHLASLKEVLAISDLFVLPSLSEGSCNALIEAMDAKLPCISTAVGNAEELIKDNLNGFLVERNNVTVLAEKLFLLADNKELLHSFRNNILIPDTIPSFEKYAENTASLFEMFWHNKSN